MCACFVLEKGTDSLSLRKIGP